MAARFPSGGPGAPPPPAGAMPPHSPQRYAGPGPAPAPQGAPMPPRPYPAPNFQRSGFTPPPAGAGGGVGAGGGAAGAGGGARPPGGGGYAPGGGAGARPPAPPPGALLPAPAAKRAADARSPMPPQHKPALYNPEAYGGAAGAGAAAGKRKKRLADKILPQKVRDLVPESQAYMDLLAFERKLDATILRKRLDIQEALKRPMKQKRKLRIFISNTFYPGQGDGGVASWELRVEGRLLDDAKNDPNKVREAQVLVVLQVPGDRAGQGAVRAGQPPGGVAPHAHHAGDGRLPGEAARVQECALHHPAAAGLPAAAVQAGPAAGAAAGRAHADAARHRQRAVAVRQDAPPAGPARARAHAVRQVPRADLRRGAHEAGRGAGPPGRAAARARPHRHQPRDRRGAAARRQADRLLRHRRRGGRHAQDADEQLPAEHGQPAGDPGARRQDTRDGGHHQPAEDQPRVLPELQQGAAALRAPLARLAVARPQDDVWRRRQPGGGARGRVLRAAVVRRGRGALPARAPGRAPPRRGARAARAAAGGGGPAALLARPLRAAPRQTLTR